MPKGLRRSFAFLAGIVVTIALIGVVVVAFPVTNFSSSQTTPSRTASIAEILGSRARRQWTMMTYSVTMAAAIEILQANVDTLDRAVAMGAFAVTSIVSVAAPIAFSLVAPATLVTGHTWSIDRDHSWPAYVALGLFG